MTEGQTDMYVEIIMQIFIYDIFRTKRDEEHVCYGDVGCFRDDGPFDYLDMLPSPPEEVGTVMMLFTRQRK